MSMVIIMLLMRAWIIEMRDTTVKPRDLADDLVMIAPGDKHEEQIKAAVEGAYDYMQDMGAKVATQKSILFSSCPSTRRRLRTHVWECGKRIPVVGHARDLGAHLAISNRSYSATLRTRLQQTTEMVREIGKLPIL